MNSNFIVMETKTGIYVVKCLWTLNENTSLGPILVFSNGKTTPMDYKEMREKDIGVGSEIIISADTGKSRFSRSKFNMIAFSRIKRFLDITKLLDNNEVKIHPKFLAYLNASIIEDSVQFIRDIFYIGADSNIIDPELIPPEDDEIVSSRIKVVNIYWDTNETKLSQDNFCTNICPIVVTEDGRRFPRLSYSILSYYGVNVGAEISIMKSGNIVVTTKSKCLLMPPNSSSEYTLFGGNLYFVKNPSVCKHMVHEYIYT